MKHCSFFLRHCVLAFIAAGLWAGCKGDPPPPPEVSIDEAPAAIESAFKDTSAETQRTANNAVEAIKRQQDTRAFVELQNLSARPDLSPEQREAAAQAMMAVNQRLQRAASAGDKQATEMLQLHRAGK